MNKENTKKLHEKYPTIFQNKDLPPTQSLMCFGFECDDGWYELIDEMCEELDAIEKMTGIQTIAQNVKKNLAVFDFMSMYYFHQILKMRMFGIKLFTM